MKLLKLLILSVDFKQYHNLPKHQMCEEYVYLISQNKIQLQKQEKHKHLEGKNKESAEYVKFLGAWPY